MSKKYDKFLRNEQWLNQKYWVEKLSIHQIAKIVGCCDYSVQHALKCLNIPRRTNSETHKGLHAGKNHPLYNKHHTDAAKAKISKTRIERGVAKGELNPFYGKHHTKETKAKMDEARKHRKFPKTDTKPELIFIDFYNKFGIADRIKDTRDNSFHIGRLNPDFIIPNMKIAIFINGDYWHSPLLRYNIRDTQRVDYQTKTCKRHKWIPIIIWESDLLRKDTEQFVLSELKKHKVF